MHGARNSPWNKILFALPRKNSEREREREQKMTDEIPYTNLCCVFLLCLMLLSLSVPLSFSSLSVFAVCVLALSLCLFFIYYFFFFACSSPIYRGTKKQFFPILALNSSVQGAVWVSFSSIIPNFMVSLAPLFPLFR